ncbi:hypothetical protein K438DRAFT_2007645 [Mycena galopus ATCC 62051]|nr:hypothetical protein K438DRAFT_2007645 [Mycena galopus ATCC 62051]
MYGAARALDWASVSGLTKEYDPEGKRTIGVLTKPDRIPRGEEENWLPLIRNEQETLENNWYCVKQPASQDLKNGITWEEARARENDFFTLTPPWSDLDPMYQKFLRTSNLIGRLSSILSDLISKRLRQIQIELENTIQKTRAGLQKLPKPPTNDPVNEIASLLHQFIGELNNILAGASNTQGLLQAIRPAQERFRREIRQTAPNFRPFKDTEEISPFAFLSNENDELDSNEEKRPRSSSTRSWIVHMRRGPASCPDIFLGCAHSTALPYYSHHPRPTCELKALVVLHFSAFGQGALEQRLTVLIQDYMNQRTEAAQELIAKLIALETDGPLTLNEHYLADYKTKFLSQYKSARESKHNPILADAIAAFKPSQTPPKDQYGNPKLMGIAQALSGLTGIGLGAVTAEDLVKLLPPDRMDAALNIMADVRAYFHVAYKRIADNVPLAIDHELVRGVGRDLLPALYRGLGVNGSDGTRICREFAQESPSVAGKREELVKRLERLESASRELVHVGL